MTLKKMYIAVIYKSMCHLDSGSSRIHMNHTFCLYCNLRGCSLSSRFGICAVPESDSVNVRRNFCACGYWSGSFIHVIFVLFIVAIKLGLVVSGRAFKIGCIQLV